MTDLIRYSRNEADRESRERSEQRLAVDGSAEAHDIFLRATFFVPSLNVPSPQALVN